MTITDDREAYLKSPYFDRHIYGNFSPFYITIGICAVFLGVLLILNICCCCSKYSEYWLNRHTGNRWIVSIWSTTPHKQPPLDFTELEAGVAIHRPIIHSEHSMEYLELQKRESDI